MAKRVQIGTNGKRKAVVPTEGDKRHVIGLRELIINNPILTVDHAHDNLNHYYRCGGYGQHTITCMSRMAYSHSANSTAVYACPYATTDSLIQRVNC